jgi:hypothetical protein
MVYDADNSDVILIGSKEPGPPLDLDSLIVAMHAVLVLKQWPLVSIDPGPNSAATGKQIVRPEGIEDSVFGRDFLSADVRLKRLGLGLDQAAGIESYFAQREKLLTRGAAQAEGSSRFWFYAVDPGLEEQDGVFLIRRLALGVRAQSLGWVGTAVQPRDAAAEAFAKELSTGFGGLVQRYPEVARLRSLYEMVAVARGLEMVPKAAYSWWLNGYRVKVMPTPREFNVIRREEQIRTPAGQRVFEVSGGIQFRALTIRLMDGDATALREAVLLSRPTRGQLSWKVPVDAGVLEERSLANGSRTQQTQSRGVEDAGSTLAWKLGLGAGISNVSKPQPSPGTPPKVGGVKADIQINPDDFQTNSSDSKRSIKK